MAKVLSKTELEAEKESKLLAGEFEEKIDAMGQENEEKAAKWVIEENDQIEKDKQKSLDDALHFYTDKRKTVRGYGEALSRHLHYLLNHYVDWAGMKFKYESTYSSRGVGVIVQGPDGQTFARGFKPCGEPKYDIHAMKTLIWQTENIVEEYKERNEKIRHHRQDSRN